MKRTIDYFLREWKTREHRKPLLLRGARQVGKTHAIRTLGKTFSTFIEINLETNETARAIIERDLNVERIVFQLSELTQKPIKPGSTLLFFDEIQNTPNTINALRYFYELMPELHVIAAGSLLDFAIEQVGIPVGRVTSLYMHPVSFVEFLVAQGHKEWVKAFLEHSPEKPLGEPLHELLLHQVGIYLAIGGMPEAVNQWIKVKQSRAVKIVHEDLIATYEQDFGKYAKQHQIKYLTLLFSKSIQQLSHKFMYARIGEYQKRELEPALELLERAGIVTKVTRSAGLGIPIGAQADLNDFKIIFLDVGISQSLLKLDITPWFIDPLATFVNKGELVEAFVGQEILAYADPIRKERLYYWHKENRTSQAEVDYLIQVEDKVIPIEVKSGSSRRIKSMHLFFESHPDSPYGLRIWANNYDTEKNIRSYPLYALAKIFIDLQPEMASAVASLLED